MSQSLSMVINIHITQNLRSGIQNTEPLLFNVRIPQTILHNSNLLILNISGHQPKMHLPFFINQHPKDEDDVKLNIPKPTSEKRKQLRVHNMNKARNFFALISNQALTRNVDKPTSPIWQTSQKHVLLHYLLWSESETDQIQSCSVVCSHPGIPKTAALKTVYLWFWVFQKPL